MNNMQKIAITAAAVVSAVGLGTGALYAAENKVMEFHPMSNLASIIAQRFNLNEADVQQVIDEEHEKMRMEMDGKMAERMKEKLAKAVEAGKLTQAQADAIVAKHQEMTALLESLKDKTPEERRAALEAKHEELKAWAEEQGLAENFMHAFGPGIGGPGMKGKKVRIFHGEGERMGERFEMHLES